MLSKQYLNFLNIFWNTSNWVSWFSDNINSFELVLNIFNHIENISDFENFRRNFPPEWIYIPAVRLGDIKLWELFFNYTYEYHIKNDQSFVIRMNDINIKNKIDFIDYMLDIYNKILSWWLEYDPWSDMSTTFCKENITKIIKEYCSEKVINEFNNDMEIHPIERRWAINKVLFYHATLQNKYVDKIFDDYNEWKNTKRLAKDFLNYLDKLK